MRLYKRLGFVSLLLTMAGCSDELTQRVSGLVLPIRIEHIVSDPDAEVAIGNFELQNRGDTTRQISAIELSCNCVSMNPKPPFSVNPGEPVFIEYSIDFPSRYRDRRAELTITTDRGEKAQIILDVTRDKYFSITPPVFDFGTVICGESRQVLVTMSIPEQIHSELSFNTPAGVVVSRESQDVVKVTLNSTELPEGLFAKRVQFFLTESGTCREFVLTGSIKPLYAATVKAQSGCIEKRVIQIVRSDHGPMPRVESVTDANGNALSADSMEGENHTLLCTFTSTQLSRDGDKICLCFTFDNGDVFRLMTE